MSASNPGSFLDKVTGICLSLLVGAAAVYIAVRLLEAVRTALLVILGVAAFLGIAVVLLRARNRGW